MNLQNADLHHTNKVQAHAEGTPFNKTRKKMQDPKTAGRNSAIIYSGGLDSTTLLYEYSNRIALAITFDYGSNHAEREIECARYHCQKLGIEHHVLKLDFFKQFMSSSLLSGAEAVPEDDYDEDNMHSTVVPFRNGIMLAIACGIAEDRGLDSVLIANHGGDHAIYPDCRPDFINSMDKAMRAGTYIHVGIEAPYTNISKADIVARGAKLGIDYSHTYSCYKGTALHCGRCATCRERQEAFRAAHVDDPTKYQS